MKLSGWKNICAAVVLMLALPGGVNADALDDAFAAYQRGDYATAVRIFMSAAKQGNAKAQNNLGYMYDKGRGVPQDYAEAARWFRLAADQGNANAQNNLGAMYDRGWGVPQDDTEAVRWYSQAAEQGHADARGWLAKHGKAD